MKQLTFMGGSRATYEIPATRIYSIGMKSQILYTSDEYGNAGGNPTEDDESVLD